MESQTQTQLIITKESNGLAVTSLVLGILGLLFGVIPFVGWFFLPLWILAIIFGAIGRNKEYQRGLATTGLIIGIVTVVYKFGFWVLVVLGA